MVGSDRLCYIFYWLLGPSTVLFTEMIGRVVRYSEASSTVVATYVIMFEVNFLVQMDSNGAARKKCSENPNDWSQGEPNLAMAGES